MVQHRADTSQARIPMTNKFLILPDTLLNLEARAKLT